MKTVNAENIRKKIAGELLELFAGADEDVGMIASNSFNFPVVADDGEEGWVEIIVKVPKGTKDEEYDGYGRREEYQLKQKEKAEKKAAEEAKKAKKIAARKEKEKAE